MAAEVANQTFNPEDRSTEIIWSAALCMILAGLAVIGRFVSRRLKKVKPASCDYLIIGGLLGAWASSGIVIARR